MVVPQFLLELLSASVFGFVSWSLNRTLTNLDASIKQISRQQLELVRRLAFIEGRFGSSFTPVPADV